ncbi:MAG: hypothetical protein JRH16_19515 [Deltaproteobacteria bacterium]|nr:hypothetical protein [Deltaproteobacteria bacterium]
MSGGGRRRAAFGNLGLALAATAAVLLVAEAAVRWRLPPPRYHDAPLELDAELGFRGIPGYREISSDEQGEFAFELNAGGWRAAASQPAHGARLLFLGDSFLVGRGLRAEALLPARVEAGLAERGVVADTLNFSAIDYGSAQQLLVFRDVVGRLQPDGVVLAFFTGNDIANNEPALAGATDVGAGDYIRPYLDGPDFLEPVFLHPLRARLRTASWLFATLERRALLLAGRPRFAWLRPFPPPASQAERLRAHRAPREGLEVLRVPDPGSAWQAGWRRTFGLLQAFRREVEEAGARFLVLVIPLEEQVQRGAKMVAFDRASRRAAGVGLDEILDWNLPERRLAGFFADAGIDARLLLPGLRERAASGDNPYARDRHWNALGHEQAAREVIEWWLGERPPAAAPLGEPFPRVPPSGEAPAALDFRVADHARFLGDGWLEWRVDGPDTPGGWRIGPRSMAVLPDAGGALVLRGNADAGLAFPLAIVVEVGGETPYPVQLRQPGRFEIRVPRGAGRQRASRGYRVVLVGQHGPLDAELRIQELGIESVARPGAAPVR